MLATSSDLEHPPQQWYCPNCGQVIFGETPPDLCAFCKDFTTWKQFVKQPHPTPPTETGKRS